MKSVFLSLTFIIISLISYGQDETILEIRENFKNWQPIIKHELENSKKLYHYAWGENYGEESWYSNEINTEEKFLYEMVSVIEDDELGTFVNYDNYAFSGDWYISVDYYFGTTNKLYFIFWKMNTFQAEEPVTVEKRLYFDSNDVLVRSLESVYKMNTHEESKSSFADRDVEFESRIEGMPFYNFWKSK